MTKRSHRASRSPPSQRSWWRSRPAVLAVIGTAFGLALITYAVLSSIGPRARDGETPIPLARLGTQDVHSLAFTHPDASTILFGHHGGVLRSTDGGRTWSSLPVRQDAMAMGAAADGSIIIAGHFVFQATQDRGATWAPIDTDLPSLDIHSFARSAGDPSRMWAYLAEGGIYESTDGGHEWTRVYDGHVVNLTAIRAGGADALLGNESPHGVIRSDDGGATWVAVGTPPVAPVTSLAATLDGRAIVAGGTDGLYRSDDAGSTWRQILRTKPVLAVALSRDASTIAAVDSDTFFYRSDDGGASWTPPG